jgi:hypothetical protein
MEAKKERIKFWSKQREELNAMLTGALMDARRGTLDYNTVKKKYYTNCW